MWASGFEVSSVLTVGPVRCLCAAVFVISVLLLGLLGFYVRYLCSLLSLGGPKCGPLGPLRSLCSLCCKSTGSSLRVFLRPMCSRRPLLDLRAPHSGLQCTVISVFPAGPPSLTVFLCNCALCSPMCV